MLRHLVAIFTAFAFAGLAAQASAKPVEFFQVDGVTYDEQVPAFETMAGYEIGERPVRYADIVAYL